MPPRSISTGAISFGLVNIPIKVFSASESGKKISFNMLHAESKQRVRQQLYVPGTGEVVDRKDTVKGYEYAKDQYVVFTDDELKKFEEASSRAIELLEFVPLNTIDPLYFENGYYLGPDKHAERAYNLLVAALVESKNAAVGKYVSRGKEHVIILRPMEGRLVMQQLRHHDEVRKTDEIPIGEESVKEQELALARQFIDQMKQERFDPTKYTDEYRTKLESAIEQKIRGETITIEKPKEAPQVVDLMSALKASLEDARKPPKHADGDAPGASEKASKQA